MLMWLVPAASAGEPKWKQHTINGKSEFEAAGVFDVDSDGKLDIVSGGTWYQAPDWKPHHVRDVVRQGTYLNDFATLPLDVNGDGKTDFVTVSYFGQNVGWVENPGKADADWTYHEIDMPGTSEAATSVDLTGDGVPDVLPNPTNVVAWYEVAKKADGKGFDLKKHDFGNRAAGHGVGSGDVNGDGRIDLLTPKGWFESPVDPSRDTWAWHPTGTWARPASRSSPATSTATASPTWSTAWGTTTGCTGSSRSRGRTASRAWAKMPIDKSVASVHALIWADLDGDGKDDELVTASESTPMRSSRARPTALLIAWYGFDPKAQGWTKHVIFQGEPAKNAPPKAADRLALKDFPAGTAGTGLQLTAIDIDGDGDLDLVCPGKSGLYLFENLGDGG